MKSIGRWLERVYSENDFGRSVATSLSGAVGLASYLLTEDWVIAIFLTIITFPIFRLVSTGINEKVLKRKERKINRENARYMYEVLSDEEKKVIQLYVSSGGSVLTWREVNNEPVSLAAVESLINREVLWTSMTADGMRETFVLDSDMFDIANEKSENKRYSESLKK